MPRLTNPPHLAALLVAIALSGNVFCDISAQDAAVQDTLSRDAPTVTFTQEDTWKSLSLEHWRFKTGDSLEWADPDYDDSWWQLLQSRPRYDTLRAAGWEGIGWWRMRIVVDSADAADPDWSPLLFTNQQAGATEAYLNGERINRSGLPSGNQAMERPINREEVVPMDLKPGENLLAMRFSYTDAFEIYDFFGGGYPPGPSVVLTEAKHWQFERRPIRRFDTAIFFWVGGALFMMFLSHILLFLFFPADKSNLFFGLFAVLLLNIPLRQILFMRIPSLPLHGAWFDVAGNVMTLLALVILVAAVHQLFYGRALKVFWVLAVAAVIGYVVTWFEWLENANLIVVSSIMLELLRVTIAAIWKKKEGGWIIGAGVAAMVGLWVLVVSGLVQGVNVGPMLAMTFPISVSVLLATRAASRNRRLEEQRKVIVQHSEHLEEQVDERTSELKQSLENLKNTQDQLVHAEKMASLGSLTAGIAHEIKNPLNFINNFAEANEELAEELGEAIAKGEGIDDILTDLKQNASVIAEHGKRADSIVRAMMQHARGGAGERENMDLNILVKEYVGLAYHGKRAQVPDFNATINEDYDDSVGSISMVPQDIGRVLVNLLGNAFDAVHGKMLEAQPEDSDGKAYSPSVSVSTHRENGRAEIRVSDNGPGVPEEIRSKIFEPFFTTKPTGSGTGVGLSLSYDIVTQGHGGSLHVESSEDGGAAFVMALPSIET